MRFTKKQVLDAAKKMNLNMDIIPLETLQIGLKIELEHGRVDENTNVTDDKIIPTMKIVLAHLHEGLTYYDLLVKLERKLDERRKKDGGHYPKLYNI